MTDQAAAKRSRHAWEREGEHRYRCTRCGCTKTNVQRPGQHPDASPQWIATFERAGQIRHGLTPPCPGRLPRVAVRNEYSQHVPGPRPIREILPLLAGSPDAAADAYRAWLALPRQERGSCGYCRHCHLAAVHGQATVGCRHPAVAPAGQLVPMDEARAGGTYCGPGAALFEARHG